MCIIEIIIIIFRVYIYNRFFFCKIDFLNGNGFLLLPLFYAHFFKILLLLVLKLKSIVLIRIQRPRRLWEGRKGTLSQTRQLVTKELDLVSLSTCEINEFSSRDDHFHSTLNSASLLRLLISVACVYTLLGRNTRCKILDLVLKLYILSFHRDRTCCKVRV